MPRILKCHLSVEFCLLPPDFLIELIASAIRRYTFLRFSLLTCLKMVLEPPASESPVVLVKSKFWGFTVESVGRVGCGNLHS